MVNAKTAIDILSIGELLIDFTPIVSEGKTVCFEQNPGGAPANMLTMAAKLGMDTAFVGKVGRDAFGIYLGDVLKQNGINTDGLIFSDEAPTTLAFVHLNENGERSFSFYRNQSADVLLRANEIDMELIDHCEILHFGSLSFATEPCRSAVLDALEYAKRSSKYISYDPNYRPDLWRNKREALKGMKLGLQFADIIKLSEEEALMLSGEETIETAAKYFIDQDIDLVLITLGDQGSFYATKQYSGYVGSYEVDQIDATGAGDAFIGAVLSELIRSGCKIDELKNETLCKILRFANACAALNVTRRGGIPSMPTREEVEALITQ